MSLQRAIVTVTTTKLSTMYLGNKVTVKTENVLLRNCWLLSWYSHQGMIKKKCIDPNQ